ncbi:TMV resistance protein N-like [Bidens hawaiensis]|uniref:TMV resistance protein N-like n=1 Tax=Bidens hawaiensis TaxID=980011 RepID=UPI00404B113D
MECQKTKEQTAYPIFYDVERTEVRNQSGAVGKAFAKHVRGGWSSVLPLYQIFICCVNLLQRVVFFIKRFTSLVVMENEDVGRWRNALKEAAGISGMELKNTFNGHQAKVIQQIVKDISLKLHFINLSVDGKLVGMETGVKNVVSSLGTHSNDVRIIGIKRMGGSGKTTLARAVFDHISIYIGSKVLSAVLNNQSIIVESVSDGKYMMKKMMCGRKAFVVLDDVDDTEQLEALVGELTWFKPGSRIIFTTRDQQLLIRKQCASFSRYAFGTDGPIQGYEKLSRKVVHYAAGLPLTIKVLGSHLCGRSEHEWVDAIERLKRIPLDKTLKRLELSYNGLEDDQKEIFLDVVCMLKGETKDRAIKLLESSGFNAKIGIRVLEERSLIIVSNYDCLGFHSHIEEMGMNIIHRLHPNEPSKHSRLWIKEEIEDILVNESFTDVDLAVIMNGLRKMKELRFLYMLNGLREWKVDDVSQHFPDYLRSLCWHQYPFRSLPITFRADKLVNLEMHGSKIYELWEMGYKEVLDNLRYLDLSRSKLKTFDLGMTPHLKTLDLAGSFDFQELHMPIECTNLKFIDLTRTKVRNLNLGMTANLEELHLTRCYGFKELYMSVECSKLKVLSLSQSKVSNLNLGMIPHIEELKLDGCYNLQEIHTQVGGLKNLIYININGCSRFEYFLVDKRNALPSLGSLAKLELGNIEKLLSFGLCACTNVESSSESICALQHLTELTLEGGIPEVPKDLYRLESLEKLTLSIKEIKNLPDSICMLKYLKSLELVSCSLLEQLPNDIGRLECLEVLHLIDCISLRDIPDTVCNMRCLKSFSLRFCIMVEKLPEELWRLECLENLDIKGVSISRLPHNICQLKGLHIFGSRAQLESYGFTSMIETIDDFYHVVL